MLYIEELWIMILENAMDLVTDACEASKFSTITLKLFCLTDCFSSFSIYVTTFFVNIRGYCFKWLCPVVPFFIRVFYILRHFLSFILHNQTQCPCDTLYLAAISHIPSNLTQPHFAFNYTELTHIYTCPVLRQFFFKKKKPKDKTVDLDFPNSQNLISLIISASSSPPHPLRLEL